MFYRLCYPKRSQYLTVSIKEAAFSIHIIWLDTFMSKILPRILFIIKAMYSWNTQYSIFDIHVYYISPITSLLPLYINSPLARNMTIEHICIKYWTITVSLAKSKFCTQYRIMILLFSYLRHFHHNYCDLILILLWNKDSYSLYILNTVCCTVSVTADAAADAEILVTDFLLPNHWNAINKKK